MNAALSFCMSGTIIVGGSMSERRIGVAFGHGLQPSEATALQLSDVTQQAWTFDQSEFCRNHVEEKT